MIFETSIHNKDIISKFGRLEDKTHLCVIDLELTCWENKEDIPKSGMEIIEIGAVMLDVKSYNTISKFQSFVKPQYNSTLTDYCKNLTGITQEEVDGGESLVDVIDDMLITFLPNQKNYVFVAWGSDPAHLREELYVSVFDLFDPRYVNLKVFDDQGRGLKKALKDFRLPRIGQSHRALGDAESTAQLVKMWKVKGVDALVNKSSSYRQTLTGRQSQMVVKFQKRNIKNIDFSEEKIRKLLIYCDWDYTKAKNVFSLFGGPFSDMAEYIKYVGPLRHREVMSAIEKDKKKK